MISNNNPPSLWSTRASFVFALCALLGIILLIFSEVGLAEVGGGFRPGGGPAIGNPLNDNFDDEEDDFDDFDNPADAVRPAPGRPGGSVTGNSGGPTGGAGGGGISVGGTYDSKPGAELTKNKTGFSLSGPGTEKGIKSKSTVEAMPVDTESGDGIPASKEMITDFNFPDANVMDIAKTLGRLTGKNFILDKEVSKGQQSVTIISNSPISVSEAWRAFLTSLDMNGLAIVPSGKYLRIMRQNDAKGKNVRMYSNKDAPNTDALVTKIFKIKYISAKELENVVRTYANMGARIYGFEQTNTLIITDTGSNIDKIAKMIEFLDVEGFDAGIEVVQVKYASAVELSKLIDQLLPGTQAGFPGRPGGGFPGAGGGGNRGGNFSARRTKEGGLINTIIADERTNTMIVHANPRGADQVRELVARLDRKMPAAIGGGKVHVVYLQFADAEEMAKTLSTFSQPGSTKPTGSSGGFGGAGGGIGINPNEGALFEGQVKVSADKSTNSLVVTASPADFSTLQRVINKLDIPRDQVYMEVIIMEMSMARDNEFAANILMPKNGLSVSPTNDLANLIKDPTSATKGLILQWQDKSTFDFTPPGTTTPIKIPNMGALIKAIQVYSNGNVLATPQLMAMDNAEATFESSEQIPYTKTSNLGLGAVQTSIESKDVPLSIKIKPQLNKISNFIKLDIKANISDVLNRPPARAAEEQFPATTKRVLETNVIVADTDTVVLGGLTRDKSEETINKVPLLGDIPLLGWLFKARSAKIQKTNLMLFITPRIVRQYETIRQVLDQKLKERDEFVDKAMGGEDIHRDYRNKMIRGLPEVKTITNYNAKKVMNLEDDDVINRDRSKEESKNHVTKPTHDTLEVPAAEPVPNAQPPVPPSLPSSGGNG